MASEPSKRKKTARISSSDGSRAPNATSSTTDFPRGGGTTLTPFEHRQALREVKAESSLRRSGDQNDIFVDRKAMKARSGLSKSTPQRDTQVGGEHDGKKRARRDQINNAKRRRLPDVHDSDTTRNIAVLKRNAMVVGMRMLCIVSAIHPMLLILTLPDGLTGHVPITNISEQLTELLEFEAQSSATSAAKPPPLGDIFSIGQSVVATVVGIHTVNGRRQRRQRESQRIELSLDPKIVNDGVGLQDLRQNYVLPMTVVSTEDNGYLVSIGIDTVKGFVPYNEAPRLATGQVVRGAIVILSDSMRSFTASLRSQKVLKASIAEAPRSTALLPGLNLKALVMDKSEVGLHLKLFGIYDATASTANLPTDKVITVGQRVQVHILWEDSQTYEPSLKRISVSLMQLPDAAAGDAATPTMLGPSNQLAPVEEKSAKEAEEALRTPSMSLSRYSKLRAEEESRVSAGRLPHDAPLLSLGSTLSWNAESCRGEAQMIALIEPSKTAGRPKQLKEIQQDLTGRLEEQAPASAEDFERLLLSSPNSSFIWIQFMSFYVQLGDLIKARRTAKQALRQITYREEEEKMNVWVALLNLENKYGTEEELEITFRDACAFNDALQISLKMAGIFEDAGKISEALDIWKKTAKKYGQNVDVWAAYHRCALRAHGAADSNDTVSSIVGRSLQSLEKRSHVGAVSAFAINDFKFGYPESGRTMFEGLVDAYPRRLDIWFQYVDQEIRLGQASYVRSLFERMLTGKMSKKNARSILRKWLEYEKKDGDNASQDRVLRFARDYVESE